MTVPFNLTSSLQDMSSVVLVDLPLVTLFLCVVIRCDLFLKILLNQEWTVSAMS